MANSNDIAHLDARDDAIRNHDDNVHRLERHPSDGERVSGDSELSPGTRALNVEARESEAKSADATNVAAKTSAPARKSFWRPMMFALLPIVLLIGGYFYVTGGAVMSTDNAYVEADVVGVSTDVSGIVKQVLVHDNQRVAKGDILFKLDDQPFKLALDKANAQLGITKNELMALRASYRDMQAQIEQAKADVGLDQVNFDRQQKLAKNDYTSQATLDASRNTLRGAEQRLASLNEQLQGIAAQLNGNPDASIEDHPKYKAALAARDEAARQLSHTVVRAPFDGIVTNVPSLQPGQYLAAAATAFNIVSTDHMWVEANPKETELTSVKPGQKATIEVDTYPGQKWTGTVESISPASSSTFSLLPAENTSGNWVKVVQRIPIRVRINSSPDKPPLRVGMSVELSIDTGHARGLPHFITSLFGSSANSGTESG
jgi:membrane fusion protein (multidrug efflux system)